MRLGLVAVAAVAWGATCWAVPFTVRVGPTADAVVREIAPDENYGAGGAVAVSGSAATNGFGEQMGLLDSFLRFPMADLVSQMDAQFGASNWAIQSATLRLNEQARPNNDAYNRGQGQFEVRWIDADGWIEGTGKPNNPRADGITWSIESLYLDPLTDVSLGVFDNHGPDHPDDFVDVFCDLDLATAFVDDILAGGDVSLFLTAASDAIGFQAAARENKDTASHPYLEIVADVRGPDDLVPEPATLSLLGVGLLVCLRRRRS